MARITIENFGPVRYFDEDIKDIMLFIGPQASGKSTIAKLIFFFRYLSQIPYIWEKIKRSPLTLGEFKSFILERFQELFGINPSASKHFKVLFTFSEREYILMSNKAEFTLDFSGKIDRYLSDSMNLEGDFLSKILDPFNNSIYCVFVPENRVILSKFIDLTLRDRESKSLYKEFSTNIFYDSFWSLVREIRRSPSLSLVKVDLYPEKTHELALLEHIIRSILKGEYSFTDDHEKIFFGKEDDNYVDFIYASSGQRHVLWIILLALSFLLRDDRKVFTVFEEPETHLYPEAQNELVQLISLLANANKNQLIIETHSPYILSAFNNLLYAYQVGTQPGKEAEVGEIVDRHLWIDPSRVAAYFINGDEYHSIMDEELNLIRVEEIDRASAIINETYDRLFDLDE